MFGIHDFGLFLLTGILLNLTPGPDTLYIVGRSVAQGRAAGVASVFGISTGSMVHTLAAAFGLSALLAASASAFLLIKIAGAAYLAYLGARMLLSRGGPATTPASDASSGFWPAYRQGLLTNILNPKVALFFLALMPQFIAPESIAKTAAFITLGLCFITTGTLWCLGLAWFASSLGESFRRTTRIEKLLNHTVGALFVFLGVRLATSK